MQHEYKSRTQKSIRSIATSALQTRVDGISAVRDDIAVLTGVDRMFVRELIASMNYSAQQAQKELRFRNSRKRK